MAPSASQANEWPGTAGSEWVELGRVLRAHALDGSLLVALHGEDADSLIATPRVLLRGSAGAREFETREVRPVPFARSRGARVRLRLAGIDSREQAEPWSGASLSVAAEALPALPEGEYYWRELIGLECVTLAGASLGVVEEIWPTGSNDVLVVRGDGRTTLVPALHDVLVRVDLAARKLWIDPPAGLLEPS
jgi:16S rRNA processing protein RimM